MKDTILAQTIRDIVREELSQSHMASKAWVRKALSNSSALEKVSALEKEFELHIDHCHRRTKPIERISILEKQVKKLFAEMDKVHSSQEQEGKPQESLDEYYKRMAREVFGLGDFVPNNTILHVIKAISFLSQNPPPVKK